MIIYKEKSKQIVTILFLFFIFLLNLSIEYSKYLDLIEEEIFETQVEVLNIYQKDDFDHCQEGTLNELLESSAYQL